MGLGENPGALGKFWLLLPKTSTIAQNSQVVVEWQREEKEDLWRKTSQGGGEGEKSELAVHNGIFIPGDLAYNIITTPIQKRVGLWEEGKRQTHLNRPRISTEWRTILVGSSSET